MLRLAGRTLVVAVGLSIAAALADYEVQAGNDLPEMPIRGIVRALNQSSISIDLPVRVSKLHYREAESFKKGEVLVSFDCERFEAEHAALAAEHREQRLQLKGNAYLDRLNAVARVDVEVSRARVSKAKAKARALAARLKQCRVVAPFDGRITKLRISEHEIPASGKPFITIVDEAVFEIELIAPSVWLRHLRNGTKLDFVIDETGLRYEAKVARIGASVDPVSQTIRITARFAHPYEGILAGMSGTAKFSNQVVREK